MKILTLLFLIAGCCLPILGYSQITYVYSYGASGNRESRVILKSAHLPADSLSLAEAQKQEAIKEMFEKKQITIYPNPTKGYITVEITLTEEDNAQISLYDLRGKLILEYKNVGISTNIDLTNEPVGIYLMKIFIGNKPTTWKIIKQN